MPKSKWTKSSILDGIEDIFGEGSSEGFSKFSKDTLFSALLKNTSWHHTGAFANRTDFYSIDEDAVIDFAAKNNIASFSDIIEKNKHAKDQEEQDRKIRELQREKEEKIKMDMFMDSVKNTVSVPEKDGIYYIIRYSFRGNDYDIQYTDKDDAEDVYRILKSGKSLDWKQDNLWESLFDRTPWFSISM